MIMVDAAGHVAAVVRAAAVARGHAADVMQAAALAGPDFGQFARSAGDSRDNGWPARLAAGDAPWACRKFLAFTAR